MFMTGQRDYRANRWEAFVRKVHFEGYDFSAATFGMQVRRRKDEDGTPLVDLPTVLNNMNGIKVDGVTTTNGIPTTTVIIRINELSMEAMPGGSHGADVELRYDLQITPVDGDKFRALEGKFTVMAGVTQ